MKLILKSQVQNLGEAGEVVSVKPGFGRNYLLPQGLAYEASPANIKKLEDEQRLEKERSRRDFLEANRRAAKLEGLNLTFHVRAGEEGKLFGSVTNQDVAARLNEGELDFEVDRRHVHLDEPIKALGSYRVPVRFHGEVEVEVGVDVVEEEA